MAYTEPTDINSHLIAPLRPHVMVLFGATGDLARRKLLPGLFHLAQSGLLPEYRIIGTSLDDFDDESFRTFAREALDEFAHHGVPDDDWQMLCRNLSFVCQSSGPDALARAVKAREDELGGSTARLHYLSIPPAAAPAVLRMLSEADLAERAGIIMEKPFGTNLATSIALNDTLHETFDEKQIFRIDHFLGKEAALNILNRHRWFGANTPAISTSPECVRTPTPRRSSRSAVRSTTGGGRACPSTCAPANAWPRARASSRSRSVSRPRACSPRERVADQLSRSTAYVAGSTAGIAPMRPDW
jgi:hypothetical protein